MKRAPSVKKFGLVALFLTILLSLHVIFYIINWSTGNSNVSQALDAVFGSQVIILFLLSVVGLIYGVVHSKTAARAAVSLMASLLIVVIPASIIFKSGYYWKWSGMAPAGAEFNCLVWDNQAYGSILFDKECVLFNMPLLNTSLINKKTSWESAATPFYFVSLFVNETIVAGGILLARRQLNEHVKPPQR